MFDALTGTGRVGVKGQVRNFSLFNKLVLPLPDEGGRRRGYITTASWRRSHLPCSGLIRLIEHFRLWLPKLIYLFFICDSAAQWWQKIDCAEILKFTPFHSKIKTEQVTSERPFPRIFLEDATNVPVAPDRVFSQNLSPKTLRHHLHFPYCKNLQVWVAILDIGLDFDSLWCGNK